MISKPPPNWSDEGNATTAVQSAVAVAQYTTSATKRGFHLLKGAVLAVIALVWGFAGFAQFAMGSLGRASEAGAGILTLLLAAIPGYFAWRSFKKAFRSDAGSQPKAFSSGMDTGWPQENASKQESRASFGFDRNDNGNGSQQFAQEPAKFNAPRGGETRYVENSRAQLVKSLVFNVIWIPFGLYLLQTSGVVAKLIGLAVIICGAILALKAVRGLMGVSPAFSYDGDGITVPGWFGEKHLAWRDVSDFSVKTLSTYAYGIVKVSSKHMLYALKAGGGKMLLPTQFTGFDVDALHELAARLELYRSGAAGAGPRFSQDYSSAAPTPSAGFGRMETTLAPAAPFAGRPGAASAPSFGRRHGVFDNRVS